MVDMKMRYKIYLLIQLDNAGVGYCSPESIDEDPMGVGIAFEQILKTPVELLEEMAVEYV